MNIRLQMAREDFPTSFCETLEHFLRWRDKRDYRVTWDGATRPGSATLYIHPRIGIAAPKWTDPRHFAFLWREMRTGRSRLESLARRAYLAAHLAGGPLRPLLAAHRVTIEPRPARFADGFYVPGGNQLRWFDRARGHCYVALKRGFPHHFFAAQTEVRSTYDVPAPELLEVDRDAQIFVEAISPARAHLDASPGRRASLVTRALAALEPLATATRETTTSGTYAEHLAATVTSLTPRLPDPLARRIELATSALVAGVEDDPLETVRAHGDLNLAHILEGEGGLVLVDWEHSRRRQREHDRLALELRPQLPDRFFAALSLEPVTTPLRLLVLEGLEFHVRESANPKLSGPTSSLTRYVDGLETLTWLSGTLGAS